MSAVGGLSELVARALAEDLGAVGDITSALLPPGLAGEASLVPRAEGVLAGRAAAAEVFAQVDPAIGVDWRADDGDRVVAGTAFARVEGPLASILTAERTALNFLGHLSGIASLTSRYVEAVAGTGAAIRDTRKTTPGLRALEKYAVRCGGGDSHRADLAAAVLIKDNHLAALDGDVRRAVSAARDAAPPGTIVEVECDTLDQVHAAAEAGADIILLDNMPPAVMGDAVSLVAGRALTEASGGISLQTVRAIAATGVDRISIGALTHSAGALDVGLDAD